MAGSAMSLAMAFGGSAQALDFTVDNAADGGEGSLRQAITLANSNAGPDTILFDSSFDSPQTINLTSGALFIDDPVTIEGPGSDLLTIDGAEQTDRIFEIVDAESVDISGMTMTGGRTPDGDIGAGGAILSYVSDLTLEDTVITGNVVDDDPADVNEGGGFGGGVAVVEGSLTIHDSVISGNTAGQEGDGITFSLGVGGGIFAGGANVVIENSTVSGNKALNVGATSYGFFGGGVAVDSGNLTIQGSTISGNLVGNAGDNGSSDTNGAGGGVWFSGYGELLIEKTTISDNVAGNKGTSDISDGLGGGVFFDGGQLTIRESTISGNVAGNDGTSDTVVGYGGGALADGNTLVQTSTISDNTAGSTDGAEGYALGGGLFAVQGVTVLSSTIFGNQALVDGGSFGGGIADGGEGPTSEMHNSIVAGNSAGLGPDLFGDFTVNYSLIEDASDHAITNTPVMLINGLSPDLGPLTNNGGPTETHALTQASPAFNTGDLSNCSEPDQRGVTRPQLGGCDMGAFELDVPLEGLLELFDTAVDEGDLEGRGPGKSAPNRLNTFRHWLANAVTQFEGGDVDGACDSLQSALNRTDGVAPPPDFVEGDAADDVAAAISAARASIGCE